MTSSPLSHIPKQPPSSLSLLGAVDVGSTREHPLSWSLPRCCHPPKEPVVLGVLETTPLRSDRAGLASPRSMDSAAKILPRDWGLGRAGMLSAPQGMFCSAVANKLQDLLLWLVQQHEIEVASALEHKRCRAVPQLFVPTERAQNLQRVSDETECNTTLQGPAKTPDQIKNRSDEPQDSIIPHPTSQGQSMTKQNSGSIHAHVSMESTVEDNGNSRHSSDYVCIDTADSPFSPALSNTSVPFASPQPSLGNVDSIGASISATRFGEVAQSKVVHFTDSMEEDAEDTRIDLSQNFSRRVRHAITHVTTSRSGSGSPWLKVRVISASGLRKADITSHSDPYCVIEIPGKGECKFRTTVINDTENPIWEQEFELHDYDIGDVIKFTVFDKDLFTDECLGSATLNTTSFFPAGYHGELLLNEGDWAEVGRRACLLVKVHVHGIGLLNDTDGLRTYSRRREGEMHRLHDVWKNRKVATKNLQASHTVGTEKLASLRPQNSDGSRTYSDVERLMKLEEARSKPWYLLHPLSLRRYLWEIIGVLFVFHDIVMVPIEIFFHRPCTALRCVLAWVHSFFWTLDIVVSFFTGAYRNGVIQFSHKIIAARYLRGWFLVDVLLVLVGWIYIFAESGSDQQASNVAVDFFSALRILYFIRIAKVAKYADRLSAAGLLSIMVSAVCFHFVSCAWYGLGRAISNGWIHRTNIHADGDFDKYLLSVCWMLSLASGRSLSTFDEESLYVAERMFIAAASFSSFFLAAWVLGHITAHIMTVTDSKVTKVHRTCFRYLQDRRIPPELAVRARKSVNAYQRKHFLERRAQHEAEMLMMLPSSLQAELCEAARAPALLNLRVMFDICEIDRRVIRKICHKAVREQTCLKGLRVFCNSDACTDVHVVESGCMEYWRGANKSNDAHLKGEVRQAANEEKNVDLFATLVHRGQILCEPSLWTSWNHCGDLDAVQDTMLLSMNFADFGDIIMNVEDLAAEVSKYARLYVQELNRTLVLSDLMTVSLSLDSVDEDLTDSQDHFIFLSHYKVEAGTEATLMREAVERMIADDPDHPAHVFIAPVFVDSEDLTDLSKLKEHIARSHNILLLLTPGVLSRPWCLVEIVTAVKHSVPIVPVEVQRPGNKFVYPSDDFYSGIRSGDKLSTDCLKLLKAEGISLGAVEKALRKVFQKIALSFSPHKTSNVRSAELEDILKRCSLKPIPAHSARTVPRAFSKGTSFASAIAEKVISGSTAASALLMSRSTHTKSES